MNFLALVGAAFLIKTLFPLLKSLLLYVLPRKDMRKLYAGEWAIVSGSTEGIGKCLAKKLAEMGYNICQISRNEQKLQETEKELLASRKGVKCKYIVADLSQSFENGDELYARISEELRQLNDIAVLVNNAGIIELGRFVEELSEDCLYRHLNVNCLAVARLTRIVLPLMLAKEQGQASDTKQRAIGGAKRCLILNVSSSAGENAYAYHSVYSASKAFVTFFSESLRKELLQLQLQQKSTETQKIVDVLCFKPHYVQTQMVGFKKNAALMVITPEQCVNGLLRMIGKESSTHGHWLHMIAPFFLNLIKQLQPRNSEIMDSFECKINKAIVKGWSEK